MSLDQSKNMRGMSPSEREFLDGILQKLPNGWKRLKQGCENAFVMFASSMLALVLTWAVFAWLGKKVFKIDFGWHSSIAIWVVIFGSVACLILATMSTVAWVRSLLDSRPVLSAELIAGVVIDENLLFTEAKSFQEPEHGGVMYFLRTIDDKVFVLFDYESQDIGVAGRDPLASNFKPMSQLKLVRTPNSGFVVTKEFSGSPIEVGAPLELLKPPKQWPKPESWCDVPWNELEAQLGSK